MQTNEEKSLDREVLASLWSYVKDSWWLWASLACIVLGNLSSKL